MRTVEATDYRSAGTRSHPTCEVSDGVRCAVFEPEASTLWSASIEIDRGGELRWAGPHGDEALYVYAGSLEVDGEICAAGDVIIAEAGVVGSVRAVEDARVVHFGPRDPEPPGDGAFGAPAAEGRGIHVRRAAECALHTRPGRYDFRMFADSTCPTCRITLFTVDGFEGYRTGSHMHSQDEIVHVLRGELQVGRMVVDGGMAMSVPGNQRYGFRARSDFAFINYRRDVATVTRGPNDEPVLETTVHRNTPVAAGSAAPD